MPWAICAAPQDVAAGSGCLIYRVPFAHVRYLHDMVSIVRQQLVFNELFVSCFRGGQLAPTGSPPGREGLVVEVVASPPTSITLTVAHPAWPALLAVHLTTRLDGPVRLQLSPATLVAAVGPSVVGRLQQVAAGPAQLHRSSGHAGRTTDRRGRGRGSPFLSFARLQVIALSLSVPILLEALHRELVALAATVPLAVVTATTQAGRILPSVVVAPAAVSSTRTTEQPVGASASTASTASTAPPATSRKRGRSKADAD